MKHLLETVACLQGRAVVGVGSSQWVLQCERKLTRDLLRKITKEEGWGQYMESLDCA